MLRKFSFTISLLLFLLNFLPFTEAQNMEIEVEGAGYRILGPDTIDLPDVTAAFSEQTSTRDLEDLNGEGTDIEIVDENGGAAFNVNVSASNFSGSAGAISNANIAIKNYDGDGASLTVVEGFSQGVSLSATTDAFASLDVSRTLFQATNEVLPGHWRIFPTIQVTIPAGTKPGTYTSTLTFTIS